MKTRTACVSALYFTFKYFAVIALFSSLNSVLIGASRDRVPMVDFIEKETVFLLKAREDGLAQCLFECDILGAYTICTGRDTKGAGAFRIGTAYLGHHFYDPSIVRNHGAELEFADGSWVYFDVLLDPLYKESSSSCEYMKNINKALESFVEGFRGKTHTLISHDRRMYMSPAPFQGIRRLIGLLDYEVLETVKYWSFLDLWPHQEWWVAQYPPKIKLAPREEDLRSIVYKVIAQTSSASAADETTGEGEMPFKIQEATKARVRAAVEAHYYRSDYYNSNNGWLLIEPKREPLQIHMVSAQDLQQGGRRSDRAIAANLNSWLEKIPMPLSSVLAIWGSYGCLMTNQDPSDNEAAIQATEPRAEMIALLSDWMERGVSGVVSGGWHTHYTTVRTLQVACAKAGNDLLLRQLCVPEEVSTLETYNQAVVKENKVSQWENTLQGVALGNIASARYSDAKNDPHYRMKAWAPAFTNINLEGIEVLFFIDGSQRNILPFAEQLRKASIYHLYPKLREAVLIEIPIYTSHE